MTESLSRPIVPFIYLNGGQMSKMWGEFSAEKSSDPKAFLAKQDPMRKFRYAAALNAMSALVSCGISPHDVRKVSFRRDESRAIILDIQFWDFHPTDIASINLNQAEDIPQVSFPFGEHIG